MEIQNVLKQFIVSELVVDSALTDLNETESLIDNGVLDSMGMIKVLTFIEDEFSIKVADDELVPENFESVYAISNLIYEKISHEQVN